MRQSVRHSFPNSIFYCAKRICNPPSDGADYKSAWHNLVLNTRFSGDCLGQLLVGFFILILVTTGCAAPTATPLPPPTAPNPTNQPTRQPTDNPPGRPTDPPTVRPSDQPTRQPTDVPTPTTIPSPTPEPAQLIQLMEGGCCASPGWYSDSETILFIDKPNPDAPTGFYSVNLNQPNTSALWSKRIAFYTSQFDFAQIPEQAGTRLIRVSDGKELRVKNGGRSVSFSPDRTQIAWTETRDTFPIENRVSNIMLAPLDFDGAGVGQAKRLTQVLRGGVSGWLDNHRLLLNGRLSRDTEESTTYVYNLTTGASTTLFTAERSRLTTVSRNGTWLAYVIVNDADPTHNGLWVIRTDGTDAKKLDLIGAAQWRDDSHLVIAAFEMNAPTHAFYEYDTANGTITRLTPPTMPFKIASGDWAISPDGAKIVFVNAADNNLWLWKFATAR